eukprot:TRINITY_DN4389_c0_g1_i1.p1 TRINITY_DN4389_c0_g1~~TRINITY_DN4389_c0_g1_i1.p1  ORF type:complete len:355 (-),score=84.39 TRINITY_DN4389_c0_g1_i1:62-1126(-)
MNNQPNSVPADLPLDIAWIWCVHTLNPSSYRDDCMRAFRKIVPFHEDSTHRKKKNIMPAFHDTSYNTPFPSSSSTTTTTSSSSSSSSSGAVSPMASFQPSIDLNPAVMRQLSFLKRSEIFSTAKPIMYLRLRLQYARFLLLMREYGKKHTLVPTLGIDLMWHAHMITPECYEADCKRIVGRFVNHDDSIDEKSLAASLEVTSQLWNKHHNSEYIKARPSLAQSQKNNNQNNNAAATSSGCGGVAGCGYVPVHASTPVCGSACGARHHHQHHIESRHDRDVDVDGVSPPPASELLNCGGGSCTGEFTPLSDAAAGGGGGDAASAAASCGGASTCGGGGCGGASSCGGGCGGGCSS